MDNEHRYLAGLRDFEDERRRLFGDAATYIATKLGQQEVALILGGSGPPGGNASPYQVLEKEEFHADLEPAPEEVLM